MLTPEQIARIISDGIAADPRPALTESINTISQKIHDLCKPDHTIHVAAAAMENEVTDTLIDMLLVTVLAKLIDQEGGGRTNFSFSPMDMATVMKEWAYTVERHGLVRTVRIKPKDDAEWEKGDGDLLQHSMLARSMARANEDAEIAPPPITDLDYVKPQAAPHEYKRPVWAVRRDGELFDKQDREAANRSARTYTRLNSDLVVTVENRWCLHPECPSTGCNHDPSKRDGAEPTSD